jgi:hypothetical protein
MEHSENIHLTAKLFPLWKPGEPYTNKYNVVFDGDLIVEGSRNPETDLARALLAMGYSGTVTILDGATGKPRTFINIEKAAKLRTVESETYSRFRKVVETCAESPCTGEEGKAA